ncbi:hypothetical protein A3E46_02470 [Candidatus Woesebacteria bacterium RIFCSPHIGHO2_12_FULL_46_16]|uniref:Uncharacterized protein n=1 Tax=Candidatus Woesebacteria bacterium RIFCSPHIGHO2_12_FULL_46_16 TaxID=1802513 RepID=A0A1F8AVH7_9BACT|nr:MAG: hypothetical protein A3E46_02470 [Candidatus Woesebacteria bacterium RIFCSPHIGHO2_12_FULL_46_16]
MGLGIGVVGIFLSIYFYLRGKQIKQTAWVIISNTLVEDYSSTLTGLSVIYKKREVQNLTISKLAFWNKGSVTIDGKDLKTVNPLKIGPTGETQILDLAVVKTNNESSNFSIKKMGNSRLICFDYLNPNDGAVFQIIHTGISSKDVEISGKIRGCTNIKHVRKVSNPSLISIIYNLAVVSLGIVVLISAISQRKFGEIILPITIIVLYSLLFILDIGNRVPKGLESLLDYSTLLYKKRRIT